MAGKSYTPIIIGVGDVVNRSTKIEDAVEPLDLISQAVNRAFNDTRVSGKYLTSLRSNIDNLDVVASWTWPYPDLPSSIAENVNIQPSHKHYSPHGGNQPGKLFDEAARRISQGHAKVALLTGGEALASLTACAQAKRLPPPGWTPVKQSVDSVFSPTTRGLGDNLGAVHGIGAPIQVYPLFENGFRAHRHQSIEENNTESAKLYAEFAQAASQNELAWSYGAPAATEAFIGMISEKNRMICYPYPLLMNAFNTVNLASAVLLTSTEFATQLGIPEDRWIYALGGAGTSDSTDFWKRPNYHTSPAISRSIDTALAVAGLQSEDVDLFDFYSCFPIVPKLACHHLGLPLTGNSKPITLLGGLTSFGGAGNNYSMHAIAEMTRQLRRSRHQKKGASNGLILANGGVLTYQHVIVLSTRPKHDGAPYPSLDPLPDLLDVEAPVVDDCVEGEAEIETYTVDFNRNGKAERGHVVGRLKRNGHRFVANHGDVRTLHALINDTEDPIGRAVFATRSKDGKRNVVFVDSLVARL